MQFRTMLLVFIMVMSVLIAILLLVNAFIPKSYEELITMAGQEPKETGQAPFSQTATLDYSLMKDYSYDSFVLADDDGSSADLMKYYIYGQHPRVYDCSKCVYAGTTDGKGCLVCNGKSPANYHYNYCEGCEGDTCHSCSDVEQESTFCQELKRGISLYASDPEYYSVHGYEISVFERAQDEQFDLEWIKNALAECRGESLLWNAGGNIQQEICNFPALSASNVGFASVSEPKSFYFEESKCLKRDEGTQDYEGPEESLFTNCKTDRWDNGGDRFWMIPFGTTFIPNPTQLVKKDGEQMFSDNYRTYAGVAFESSSGPDSNVHVAKFEGTEAATDPGVKEDTDLYKSVQRIDMLNLTGTTFNYKVLDYPASWYDDATKSKMYGLMLESSIHSLCVKAHESKHQESKYCGDQAAADYPYKDKPKDYESNSDDPKRKAFFATLFEENYTHAQMDYDMRLSNCVLLTNLTKEINYPYYGYDASLKPTWPNSDIYSFNDKGIKVFYSDTDTSKIDSTKRGAIRIMFGGLDLNQKDCKFNIYVCSQDAAAATSDGDTLKILDLFRFYDITKNIYQTEEIDDDYNLIKYNDFKLELSDNASASDVATAIESGFREWRTTTFPQQSAIMTNSESGGDYMSNTQNSGLSTKGWYTERLYGISYDDCTLDNDYAGAAVTFAINNGQNVIAYNCGDDNICTGELKMSVNFVQRSPSEDHPWLSPLETIVTVCGE